MRLSSKITLILAAFLLLGAGGFYVYALLGGKLGFKAEEKVETKAPAVEIKENKLYVNSSFVFPLGLWGVPSDSVFGNSKLKLPLTAQEIKDAGFNILMPAYPINRKTDVLSEKEISGLYRFVFIRQKDGLNAECQKKDIDTDPAIPLLPEVPSLDVTATSGLGEEAKPEVGIPAEIPPSKCFITSTIKSLESRSDVIGWFGADEPAMQKPTQPEVIPVDALKAGYDLAKKTDPLKRPVWIDQAPAGLPPPTNFPNYSTINPYNAAMDIFSTYIYPVPKSTIGARFKNKNVALVGEIVSALKTVANSDKKRPFWMFLQGAEKAVWAPPGGTQASTVRPTKEEQRFMAYDSLIHGADGLFWFGVWGLPKDASHLSDILTVVKEIKTNQDLLTAPDSALSIKVQTTNNILDAEGKSAIHFKVKKWKEQDYIIVANNSEQEIEATFETPVAKVLNYPSGEKVAGLGDNFKQKIEAFGVRIYQLATKETTPTIDESTLKDKTTNDTLVVQGKAKAGSLVKVGVIKEGKDVEASTVTATSAGAFSLTLSQKLEAASYQATAQVIDKNGDFLSDQAKAAFTISTATTTVPEEEKTEETVTETPSTTTTTPSTDTSTDTTTVAEVKAPLTSTGPSPVLPLASALIITGYLTLRRYLS
ncbi:hypothetical protein HYU72_02315 [Candidatus Berkelbacteria bacterium]|nr:hypothetical protein [Candidatus Berkelbacteria bacterium]